MLNSLRSCISLSFERRSSQPFRNFGICFRRHKCSSKNYRTQCVWVLIVSESALQQNWWASITSVAFDFSNRLALSLCLEPRAGCRPWTKMLFLAWNSRFWYFNRRGAEWLNFVSFRTTKLGNQPLKRLANATRCSLSSSPKSFSALCNSKIGAGFWGETGFDGIWACYPV